jgi:hypothetical protein
MTTLFVLAIVAAGQHRPRVGGNDRHRPQIWATCRRSLGDPAANAIADNDSSITMSASIVREVLLTTEWVLAGYAGDRRKW